jgi:hypothetical protein
MLTEAQTLPHPPQQKLPHKYPAVRVISSYSDALRVKTDEPSIVTSTGRLSLIQALSCGARIKVASSVRLPARI